MVEEIHTYVAIICSPCFGAKVQNYLDVGGIFHYSGVMHVDHRFCLLVPVYRQYTIKFEIQTQCKVPNLDMRASTTPQMRFWNVLQDGLGIQAQMLAIRVKASIFGTLAGKDGVDGETKIRVRRSGAAS